MRQSKKEPLPLFPIARGLPRIAQGERLILHVPVLSQYVLIQFQLLGVHKKCVGVVLDSAGELVFHHRTR